MSFYKYLRRSGTGSFPIEDLGQSLHSLSHGYYNYHHVSAMRKYRARVNRLFWDTHYAQSRIRSQGTSPCFYRNNNYFELDESRDSCVVYSSVSQLDFTAFWKCKLCSDLYDWIWPRDRSLEIIQSPLNYETRGKYMTEHRLMTASQLKSEFHHLVSNI